jgi:3-hydroxyisobutyrate dehydrogenase
MSLRDAPPAWPTERPAAVGYIGLGNMGAPMAARLLNGFEVAVFDRDVEAMTGLVERGARGCASPAQVAAVSDVVFLCLPTSRHVRAVLLGENGVLGSARPGAVVVDQTTGDPEETVTMAREIADRSDVTLVDAPVSGGPQGATSGTVTIMVGASPEMFARVEPILRGISDRVFHAGDIGAGHTVKLVNNHISLAQTAASLELLALAAKNGVDPHRAWEILCATESNAFLDAFVAPQILSGALDSGFTLEIRAKDAALTCRLGAESGAPMLLGTAARDLYHMAVNMLGASADGNALACIIDGMSGTALVPKPPSA